MARRSALGLVAGVSAVLASGCGEPQGSGGRCTDLRVSGPGRALAPEVDAADCAAIEGLEPARFTAPAFGIERGMYAHLSSSVGKDCEGVVDALALVIRDTGLGPGTYALGEGLERDPTRCERCVFVHVDAAAGFYRELYVATAGRLQLDRAEPDDGVYAGELTDVVLQRMSRTGAKQLAVDGWDAGSHCLHLERAAFDTSPSSRECAVVTDCPNQRLQACDPRTGRCSVDARCMGDGDCAEGDVCRAMAGPLGGGACHPACDPTADPGCPDGFHCIALEPDGARGACVPSGDAGPDEACEPTHVQSGCRAGTACSATLGGRCVPTCSFFAEQARCAEGSTCVMLGQAFDPRGCAGCHRGGACLTEEHTGPIDPAQPGEPCDPRSWWCGREAGAARGLCTEDDPEQSSDRVCRPLCRVGLDACEEPLTCAPWPEEDGDLGWCA